MPQFSPKEVNHEIFSCDFPNFSSHELFLLSSDADYNRLNSEKIDQHLDLLSQMSLLSHKTKLLDFLIDT